MRYYVMNLYKAYLIFVNEKKTYGSADTVEYYSFNLLRFLEFLSPDYKDIVCTDFDLFSVQEYIRYLRTTGIKNVSINTYSRAIKHFVKWLSQEEMIDKDFSS